MAIPKILHFIWAGGSKLLPEENAKRIKAWAEKNPGFEVTLWVDSKTTSSEELAKYIDAPYFFNDDPKIVIRDINNKDEGVVDEYSRYHIDKMMPNYGASSDILRYAILKKYGGAYFDSDVIVDDETKPLNYDGLFDTDKTEILKINQFIQNAESIGNDGFICTPEHPFMAALYETAKKNHREVTKSTYGSSEIYGFDASDSLDWASVKGRRGEWTIACTGPGAVVQVCEAKNMLEEVTWHTTERKIANLDFYLDRQTYKPAPQNDGNWMKLRVIKYSNPEDAIQAALKEIHFETKNMGFLVIDYHVKLIMKSLEPTSLKDEEIAEKLVTAMKQNQPDLSKVSCVQLLSKFSAVRDYYRQYTPGIDDNLQGCETVSWPTKAPIQTLGDISENELIKISIDYAMHVYSIINKNVALNPKDINLSHLTKLAKLKAFLAAKPADNTISSLVSDIDDLIRKTVPIFFKNHVGHRSNTDELITEFALLIEQSKKPESITTIYNLLTKPQGEHFTVEVIKMFRKHSEDTELIAKSYSELYEKSPSLIQFIPQLIAERDTNAVDILDAISILYANFEALVSEKNCKLLAEHIEDFHSILSCLNSIPDVNDEQFELLAKHNEHIEQIDMALASVTRYAKDFMANNENIKLLIESGKNAKLVASALKTLSQESALLVNHTTLKLLVGAKDDSIAEAGSRLAALHKSLNQSHQPAMFSSGLDSSTAGKMIKYLYGDSSVNFNEKDVEALERWKFESKCQGVLKLATLPREAQPQIIDDTHPSSPN